MRPKIVTRKTKKIMISLFTVIHQATSQTLQLNTKKKDKNNDFEFK